MASISTRNLAQLVQTQAAAIQAKCRFLVDFSVGAILRAVIEGNAALAMWLQSQVLKVLAAARLSTSTGADVDTFVGDYGLTRLPAQGAIGTVTFARFTPSAQAVIPVGAQVRSADGTQVFRVIPDTSNPNYNSGLVGYVVGAGISSVNVPVQAATPGAAGNILANAIDTIVGSILYIDTVTNAAAFTGGGEVESDEALRIRYINFILSLSKSTVAAIQFAVTSIKPGVQATVMENVTAEGLSSPGFICVTVDDGTGTPTPQLISSAFQAADAVRAAGVWVGVFAPVALNADVVLGLVTDPNYDRNTLVAQVGVTVRGYVAGLALGETLYLSKLIQIALNVSPGVKSVSGATINSSAGNLVATPRNAIIPGTITVS